MKRRLKINGFIVFLAVLLITVFPAVFIRNTEPSLWGEIVEIFGIALILLGQIFRVSARGYKSEHFPTGGALIQDGPYSLVRNPMYLGILLIGLGIVLVLFKWWVVCIFLLIFIIRYVSLIFKEEKKLLATFSKDYRDYRSRVPLILPSMQAIVQRDISEYLPLKLSWLKKEIGPVLAVLLIVLFVESWEDIKNEGPGVYFREATLFLITFALFIGLTIYLSLRTYSYNQDASNKIKTDL